MSHISDGVSVSVASGNPADYSVTILHRGPRYCVRYLRCSDSPSAVVYFEYWKPEPTLDGDFSGEGFFRHRGLNAIGVMAAENDWFQHDEIELALAAICQATLGFRLIGYGGSMGAYAAINYASDLNLASVVAITPHFSIDPTRAPYETRWRDEASRIVFARDRIDRLPRLTNGWIVYDPWCVDALHVADIRRHHDLGELRVPFGGHAQMLMLQQANIFTSLLLDMLEENFSPVEFRREWRRRRRRSATYWIGLSSALLDRHQPQAALRAILQARGLPHSEPALVDFAAADALAATGDPAGARALAERWLEHPGFGQAAAQRLASWPPAAELRTSLVHATPPAAPAPLVAPAPRWRSALARVANAWRPFERG